MKRPRRLALPDGTLDLSRGEIQRAGSPEPLLAIELGFLSYLADHPGRAAPLEELHREVWHFGPRVRTRAVYFAVRKLRERLEVEPKAPVVLVGTEGRGFELRAGSIEPPPTNVEPPPTAFVGRVTELDDLHRALTEGSRLVTILGPAGMGKTRLALEFAETRLDDFDGGAWFCDLSDARSVEDVHGAMCRVLSLSSADEAGDAVGRALAALGPALVVLDNFEQIVKHGPATVGRWLASAPQIRLLVTSRERLRLEGETLLDLDPLAAQDARALFARRAQAARPGWDDDEAQVDELVARLDRLPFAIELAAARAGTLSAWDLIARLGEGFQLLTGGPRDVSHRQTLLGALDWSWSTLRPSEQVALAQIAVFRGGFTLAAAQAVLDLGPDAPPVAEVLQALIDKSLVRRTSTRGALRFGLLVTVHDYADRKLDVAGRAHAEERHGLFFAALGFPEALNGIATRGEAGWAALGPELENLVAACERACATRRGTVLVLTTLAAAEIYGQRGPVGVGIALVRRALDATSERSAELHNALGRLLHLGGSHTEAEPAYRDALERARRDGDRRSECRAWGGLANIMQEGGRLDEAEVAYASSVVLARALGDRRVLCLFLRGLAAVEHARGHLRSASERYEEAWGITREVGDRRGEGYTLLSLAALDLDQGRADSAADRYEVGRQAAVEVGDKVLEGRALFGKATAEHTAGRDARAIYRGALTLVRATGDRQTEAYLLANFGSALRSAGQWTAARQHLLDALAIFRQRGSRSAQGACHHELAAVDLAEGSPDRALERLMEGEPLLRGKGHACELGKLLCRRADALHALGASEQARAALDEAQTIAERTSAGASSDLGRLLVEARARVSG